MITYDVIENNLKLTVPFTHLKLKAFCQGCTPLAVRDNCFTQQCQVERN